jgi:hypothetical protein
MSRKIRFFAALLILSSLSLGSLSALPLQHPSTASHEEGMLTTVVDWFASFFPWFSPHGKAPEHLRTKSSYAVDPNGGH